MRSARNLNALSAQRLDQIGQQPRQFPRHQGEVEIEQLVAGFGLGFGFFLEDVQSLGADTHIRGRFYDVIGAPDEFIPNTMNLSDGIGIETNVAIASGGANSGWGFVLEERANRRDTTRELRTNFMGPGPLAAPNSRSCRSTTSTSTTALCPAISIARWTARLAARCCPPA